MSVTKTIVAIKHNERRNGERTPSYWYLESPSIHGEWYIRNIPKHIRTVLEKANDDVTGYGLKRGWFELTLKRNLKFEDFGRVPYDIVIDIKQLPDKYTKEQIEDGLIYGGLTDKKYKKLLAQLNNKKNEKIK